MVLTKLLWVFEHFANLFLRSFEILSFSLIGKGLIGLYISRKGADLGRILLLNINRIGYLGSPNASIDLTMSGLERYKSRSFTF